MGKVAGWIAVGAIVLGIGACGNACNNTASDPTSDTNARVAMEVAVQGYLTPNLLNPNGAKYSDDSQDTVTKNSDGTYEITGYVDDTNGFGAEVRSNWDATVSYTSDTDVTVQQVKLQNPADGEWTTY